MILRSMFLRSLVSITRRILDMALLNLPLHTQYLDLLDTDTRFRRNTKPL